MEMFAFGENWESYAEKITESKIKMSVNGLYKLVRNEIKGKTFLDIGSGAGIHSLAALLLGAKRVVAVDIDELSVKTTYAVLKKYAPNNNFEVLKLSVFELDPYTHGHFDIVYSWGVLHHTGNMIKAIKKTSEMVKDGGLFVFALYRRTWMDWFWKKEKAWYSKASPQAQQMVRNIYILLFKLGLIFTKRNPKSYIENYEKNRGMDFYHDVHDWLGGYPYESISKKEVQHLMNSLGFVEVRSFVREGKFFGRSLGLFGSGCDEYVYRKQRRRND